MVARRSKVEAVRVPTSKSEILRTIAAALTEWAPFYEGQRERCAEARESGRKAMTLMVGNLPLLKWCKDNLAWDPEMNAVFTCLGKAECEWATMKDGDFVGWTRYFVGPLAWPGGRSFRDTVTRWTNELKKEESREKPWDDNNPRFILISEAREKYCHEVSAPTLAVLGRDHCKPDGEYDYMRRGQRRKVHEDQFAAYADRKGWTVSSLEKAYAFIEASQKPRTRRARLRKNFDMDWHKDSAQ